jgi:hypothetical protein
MPKRRYRTVSGIVRSVVSPRVFVAMTRMSNFPRMNHGSGATV